ncbi:hypothetical protein BP00DRAFT_146916 [Aspergillus indologenus CBS 114.80]|uniref:Uncharacterized protein n=1 Tax=Aspergillus indologenus CBS 114.80 TaxID=1450541 RepID=A0A2V5I946_9EURO|nr:hypothetical protein BP00DRAFT_146916 [Aspergillus indologenus CBS 114.80]
MSVFGYLTASRLPSRLLFAATNHSIILPYLTGGATAATLSALSLAHSLSLSLSLSRLLLSFVSPPNLQSVSLYLTLLKKKDLFFNYHFLLSLTLSPRPSFVSNPLRTPFFFSLFCLECFELLCSCSIPTSPNSSPGVSASFVP